MLYRVADLGMMVDMEGHVTAEDIKLTDVAAAALREFGLTVQTGDALEPWFPNLLCELINSTLREYQHSKIGLQKHTPMLAWTCRNLLELNVLTKYVLRSEANARNFIGHRLIDGIEIFRYAKDYQLFREPESNTAAMDEAIRIAEERKTFEKISETKFLNVEKIAGQLEMAEEYKYMNKVTSKFVHPTAWSVLARNDEGESALFKSIFFFAAARYLSEIYVAIQGHVGVHRLKPAP
jgi:hypothetical protein